MSTPFAQLEAKMAAAHIQHLSNAEGTLGGAPVQGIFQSAYEAARLGQYGAAGSALTTLTVDAATAADMAYGQRIELSGVGAFTIAEMHPDGYGLTVLVLEVAP